MAAALAAATLAAAAEGLTAVVELAALLAVDDEGRVVAELLDLLNPELDFDEVEDGGLAGPLPGFVDASLLVVAVVVDALVTAGLGLALEVELALEGCLDTVVVVGVGRGLVAAGRGAVEDVGRFGSVLVSAATPATGLGLDGLVLGAGVLAGGLATPFSVGLVARGFLSPTLAVCCGCFTGRFKPSAGFSVVDLVGRAAAPTVEELGLAPAGLGAEEELVGLLGPALAVGLVVAAFPAVTAPAGLVVVLLAVLGPALLLATFPVVLLGEVLDEPSVEATPLLFGLVVGLDWGLMSGVGGSTDILGAFAGVGGSTVMLGGVSSAEVTVASSITPFSSPGEVSSSSTLVSVNISPSSTLLTNSGVLALVGVAGVI